VVLPDAEGEQDADGPAPPAPGPINNACLTDANGGLLPGLRENTQFAVVTSGTWALLHAWYGGGPAIMRPTLLEGLAPHSKRPRVMLYPIRLDVCWSGRPNEIKAMDAAETVRATTPPSGWLASPGLLCVMPSRDCHGLCHHAALCQHAPPRTVQESVASLKARACAAFGVDPAKTEIWDFFHSSKYACLEDHLDKSLSEARVLDEQAILLDDKVQEAPC
jgi:DUSP domain